MKCRRPIYISARKPHVMNLPDDEVEKTHFSLQIFGDNFTSAIALSRFPLATPQREVTRNLRLNMLFSHGEVPQLIKKHRRRTRDIKPSTNKLDLKSRQVSHVRVEVGEATEIVSLLPNDVKIIELTILYNTVDTCRFCLPEQS